ncbi:hypothetical protein Anas_03021, partial [Armadillidium nasatum]
DLIKNSTLRFFSKTLPILKKDETLPKVAKYMDPNLKLGIWKREVTDTTNNSSSNLDSHLRTNSGTEFQGRSSRQFPSSNGDDQTIGRRAMKMVKKIGRGARSFCHNNWGFLCLIYNYITGQNQDAYPTSNRREDGFSRNSVEDGSLRPLTPCPAPSVNHRPPSPHPSAQQKLRFAGRRGNTVKDNSNKKHCDGFDNIGCFQNLLGSSSSTIRFFKMQYVEQKYTEIYKFNGFC